MVDSIQGGPWDKYITAGALQVGVANLFKDHQYVTDLLVHKVDLYFYPYFIPSLAPLHRACDCLDLSWKQDVVRDECHRWGCLPFNIVVNYMLSLPVEGHRYYLKVCHAFWLI